MPTLMFAPKFVAAVASGLKLQSIRDTARCQPGDLLSLRAWEGVAYRSKQRVLREGICVSVEPIAIDVGEANLFNAAWGLSIEVAGVVVLDLDGFARADGFDGEADMIRWYGGVRKSPYEGWIHKWKLTP